MDGLIGCASAFLGWELEGELTALTGEESRLNGLFVLLSTAILVLASLS